MRHNSSGNRICASSVDTLARAFVLANIARHGPIQGRVETHGGGRRVVKWAAHEAEIRWLVANDFARLNVSAATVACTAKGISELDRICETLWPESMLRMTKDHNDVLAARMGAGYREKCDKTAISWKNEFLGK